MPSVTVRFHAGAREAAGVSEAQLEVNADEAVGDFKERLMQEFPGLKRYERSLLFAVREEYVSLDDPLRDGDVVSCFPPVSGG